MRKGNKAMLKCIITPILALILTNFSYNILEHKTLRDSIGLETYMVNGVATDVENENYISNNSYKHTVSQISTKEEELELIPGGISIGVKINTKGILVVGFSEIDTEKGKVNSPALENQVMIGDSISKINGMVVKDSASLTSIVNKFQDKELTIEIERNGEKLEKKFKPIKSSADNKYKLGLWVRDSTAGVGTLTFYEPKSGAFGALGHPITDIDTNQILKINKGDIINSSIIDVKKGKKGDPGELKGIFVNEDTLLGKVVKNTSCGIFGTINQKTINTRSEKALRIASIEEIKVGPAEIITTVDENGPQRYSIEILKKIPQNTPDSKSMLIKITDSRLLEKTGGIVQGMSGSPIIQNNKIIGAITHVLVNKPDTGYGIYIQWMVKDANILSK